MKFSITCTLKELDQHVMIIPVPIIDAIKSRLGKYEALNAIFKFVFDFSDTEHPCRIVEAGGQTFEVPIII